MTSEGTSSIGEIKATWSQKFTDFVITLGSGQELNCHKFVLAENSSVFDEMLSGQFREAKTNSMKIDSL